jgi:hypothetical protein
MIVIAVLAAVLIIYLWQYAVYKKRALEDIEYSVSLSAEEVFEDEDVFLYEQISNNKTLPLPYVKVDTSLPAGLEFRLYESSGKGGQRKDRLVPSICSIFVMRPHQSIRRRWRVHCKTRGTYSVDSAVIVANDLIGSNPQSRAFNIPASAKNRLVVLPKAVDLDKHFTSSKYHSGDVILPRSLLTDPLLRVGTREYTMSDPMNRINWMSTAVHGKLMVNVEEYTQRHQFNIVMNMQSRDIERAADTPSTPEFVEYAITVAASVFDLVSSDNIPVRLIANVPPEAIDPSFTADPDDENASKLLMTRQYCGKHDTIEALRLLAAMPMKISLPIERMLDVIAANPTYYSGGGNIVFISAYLSERMINFYDAMEKQGVKVIFFITTAHSNAINAPERVPVYFKTYFDD